MSLKFSLTDARPAAAPFDAVIVGVFEEKVLSSAAAEIDEASNGALKRLLEAGDVTGKIGQAAKLYGLAGVKAPRVIAVGLGEQDKFDALRFGRAAAEGAKALKGGPGKSAASYLPELEVAGKELGWKVRVAALAADRESYRYTATLKQKNGGAMAEMAFRAAGSERALQEAGAIAAGVELARELGNLPPNICNPAYLAEQGRKLAASEAKLSCEVLGQAELEQLGMGALLGVARGSANEPQLIVLRYQGAADSERPYVLVGKGITFDSGGISLKPGPGMEEMKFDMMGAGSVIGTTLAVARLGLPLNLVTLAVAVENMPDGNAYRPSDVVTTMSGQTVEVLNTDAEGRLILCDALTYAQRFKPRAMVDVATLTGACVIALGKHAHGLFSRHDDFAAELTAAGEACLDRAWRLPLWDDYQQQLESGFADMANIGGKTAGAITAACFLARFTEGQRWAHLDVAGTAWDEGRKGLATGRPVGLLTQWLMDRVPA
jgi:leucyl aminopeptidase